MNGLLPFLEQVSHQAKQGVQGPFLSLKQVSHQTGEQVSHQSEVSKQYTFQTLNGQDLYHLWNR